MPRYLAVFEAKGANTTITSTHQLMARGWEHAEREAGRAAPPNTYRLTLTRLDDNVRTYNIRQLDDEVIMTQQI